MAPHLELALSACLRGAPNALALVALLGCAREAPPNEPGSVDATIGSAAGDLQHFALQGRADAERALETQLDQLHDALDDWMQAARTRGQAARDDVVARLRDEEAAVRGELEELRRTGNESWRELRADLEQRSAKFADECGKLFEQR